MSSNSKNECFINGIQYKCRTCFDPGQAVYSLTDECSNSKTWADLLKDIAQLQTNENNLLPRTVCCKCMDKLISYYDFTLQIHNVNKKYSQLLASSSYTLQGRILNEIVNFNDSLNESNVSPLEQNTPEIKLEEEQVVPYDIVFNDKIKLHAESEEKLENKDADELYTNTCNESISSIPESQSEQSNQSSNDDYNDDRNESSSSSFDESDYVPLKRFKYEKSNTTDISPVISQAIERNVFEKDADYDLIEKVNRRFLCIICKKTFPLKRNCLWHIKAIHNRQSESRQQVDWKTAAVHDKIEKDSIFACAFCEQHFNCNEYLQMHLKCMHPFETIDSNTKLIERLFGDRLYSKPAAWCVVECRLCNTTFQTTKKLRQHLEKHSDVNTLHGLALDSYIVQRLFSNILDLNIVKKCICNDIREKRWFKYYTVLNEHIYEMSVSDTEAEDLLEENAERAGKYSCQLCAKGFSFKYQVFLHLKEAHNDEEIPLNCSQCKLEFVSIKMYEQHKQTHCRNKHKVLVCAHCPGKFVWPENMKKHNCARKVPVTLPAITKDQLKCKYQEHVGTHSNDGTITAENKIRCGLCANSFQKLHHLRQHLSLHADGKTGIDFEGCIYVKYFESTKSIDLIALQLRIQNAFRKSQISRFYRAIDKYGNELDISDSDSEADVVVENAKKEYTCELCKEMFKKRKHLLNHQYERHNGVPLPFTCKECNDQYVSPKLLQQHLARVCLNEHRRIAQQCDYCNYRFIWPNNLLKHKEIQHSMISQPPAGVSTANVQLHFCLLCPKTFFSVEHVRDHLSHHRLKPADVKTVESIFNSTWWPNGEKNIKCKICGETFKNIIRLREHFSPRNTQQLCANSHSLTNYSITNEKGFELHLELDSETEIEDEEKEKEKAGHNKDDKKPLFPYKCYMCSKTFERKYQIAHHQRSMHNYELLKLKCERCIFRTVSQKVLDYHKATQCFNVEKQYECDQCNFKFMWQENLDNHFNMHHSSKELDKTSDVGEISKESLPTNACLENLNISEQPSPKAKKKCPICGIRLSIQTSLTYHLRTHTGEKPFKCEFCDKAFTRKSVLDYHRRQHTGDRPYKCTQCGKGFLQKIKLANHINMIHTSKTLAKPTDVDISNESVPTNKQNVHKISSSNVSQQTRPKRKKKCPICGVYLSIQTSLTYHMRIHTGEKPFKCEFCEKAFSRKSAIDYHRRKHTGERPYKCTQCGKGFLEKGKLADHIRIHTGECPYQCRFCQKRFRKVDYLRLHLRKHTGENLCRCEICGKAFLCNAYLKKHLKSKAHHVEKDLL